jgi:lipocalin
MLKTFGILATAGSVQGFTTWFGTEACKVTADLPWGPLDIPNGVIPMATANFKGKWYEIARDKENMDEWGSTCVTTELT